MPRRGCDVDGSSPGGGRAQAMPSLIVSRSRSANLRCSRNAGAAEQPKRDEPLPGARGLDVPATIRVPSCDQFAHEVAFDCRTLPASSGGGDA